MQFEVLLEEMFKIALLSDLKVSYLDIMGYNAARVSRFLPRCARKLVPPSTRQLEAAGLSEMLLGLHATKLDKLIY